MSDGINGPRKYGERNEWDERMKQIHLAIADAMRSHEINIHKPLREKVASLEGVTGDCESYRAISQYMIEHFDWDGEVPLHVAVCRMFGDLLTESEALRAELDEIVGMVGIREYEGYADAVERLYRQNESLWAELYDIGELVEAREGEGYADAVERLCRQYSEAVAELDRIRDLVHVGKDTMPSKIVEVYVNHAEDTKQWSVNQLREGREELFAIGDLVGRGVGERPINAVKRYMAQAKLQAEDSQRHIEFLLHGQEMAKEAGGTTDKDSDREQKAQDVLAKALERAGIPRGQREVPATAKDREVISEINVRPYLSPCCGQRVVVSWEAPGFGSSGPSSSLECSACGGLVRG